MRLDSSALEDRLITEKMTLATIDETVKSAKEAYSIQVINNESSIASGQLTIEFALLELQKYLGKQLASKLISLTDQKLGAPRKQQQMRLCCRLRKL